MKVYSISLSTKQTKAHLKAIPNWSQKVQAIYRTFNFNGFMNGIIFVDRIARSAFKDSIHHPRIHICFNQVNSACPEVSRNKLFIQDITKDDQVHRIRPANYTG